MIGFFNLEKTGSKATGEIFIPKSTRDNPGTFTIEKGEIIGGYPNIIMLLKNQNPPNEMPLSINWSNWVETKRNSPSNSIQQWLYKLFFANRSNASSLYPYENPWFESLETKKIDLSTDNTLLIESGVEGIEFNYPEYSMFYIKGDAIGYNLKPLIGGKQATITRIYQEENSLTIKDENLMKNPISSSIYFILAEKKKLSLINIVNLEIYNLYHDYLFEIMLHTEDYVDYLRDCSEPIPLLDLPYKLASLLVNDSKAKKVKGFYPTNSGSIYDYYRSPFSLTILLFRAMAKVKGHSYDQAELKVFRNSTLQMYFEENKWNHNQLFIIAEHIENLQLCSKYIEDLKDEYNSSMNSFKENMDIISNDFESSKTLFNDYDIVYQKIINVLPKINKLHNYFTLNKKKKASDFENFDDVLKYLSVNEEITSELTQVDEIVNNQPLLKYLINENHNNILYRYFNYNIKGKFQIYTVKNFIKELSTASKNLEKQKENTPKISYEDEYNQLFNLVNEYKLAKSLQMNNLTDASSFLSERNQIGYKLYSLYVKVTNDEEVKKRVTNLIINFYSQHIAFNPFETKIQQFALIYNGLKKEDISMLENYLKQKQRREEYGRKKKIREAMQKTEETDRVVIDQLHDIHNKIIVMDNEIILQYLKKIGEETRELDYDVPLNIMYNCLLNFSNLFTNNPKIKEISNDNEYTLKNSNGNLYFKYLEKEPNRKIVYEYDFLNNTQLGEKGKFTIEFIEETPGKIKLKTQNEIEEISKDNKENLRILNYLGNNLGPLIDLILAKLVAKQVQTIVYEKTFDDLTMGDSRILQAKLNAMGKDIDKLKTKYFEVKAPLTLNSFECSECGATLNITSKEEKFIICEHCSTPFLMEWQNG